MKKNVVGENIRRYRKFREMSQQDLADLAGYKTKSSINKIETGLVSVPIPKLEKIASILRVSVETLMGQDSVPQPVKPEWEPIEEFDPSTGSSGYEEYVTKKEAIERYLKLFDENPGLVKDVQAAYENFVKTLYDTISNLPLTTNADETTLLTLFRQLSAEQKNTVLTLVTTLANQK